MKPAVVLVLMLLVSADSRASDDFETFQTRSFTRVDAERLADAEFQARYGICGMVVFKERRFEAWVFETRIGYAGTKGPDLVVFSSRVSDLRELIIAQSRLASLREHSVLTGAESPSTTAAANRPIFFP